MATLGKAESFFDRATGFERGSLAKAVIQTYRSYGTHDVLHVKGRVLQDRKIARAGASDSKWRTLALLLKRALSREISGATVTAIWNGREVSGSSDEEGYFHLEIDQAAADPTALWHEVDVRLDLPGDGSAPVRAIAHVLVPSASAAFAVISDIDDTVIRTDATSLYRMGRTILFENAHVRLPFEGVSAFYRELHCGVNPIFYVSSGPWNLYDVLEQIFEIRGIPPGPLFLQDWGIEPGKLITAQHDTHKREQIDTLVGTYALPFLLIGDSGQRDPEIYDAVARHYPGRVHVIYIRDVKGGARRAEVMEIAKTLLRDTGVEMLLVGETTAAASDAAARGFIASEGIPEVVEEKARDESAETSL